MTRRHRGKREVLRCHPARKSRSLQLVSCNRDSYWNDYYSCRGNSCYCRLLWETSTACLYLLPRCRYSRSGRHGGPTRGRTGTYPSTYRDTWRYHTRGTSPREDGSVDDPSRMVSTPVNFNVDYTSLNTDHVRPHKKVKV